MVAYARAHQGETLDSAVGGWLPSGLLVPELGGASSSALAGLARVESDLVAAFPGSRPAAPMDLPQALMAAVLAVAEFRPGLLVLGDAHRADRGTIVTLVRLLEQGAGRKLAVLLTASRHPPPAIDEILRRSTR